jgi:hypothetical protein
MLSDLSVRSVESAAAVNPPDAARSATGVMQAVLFAEILKPLTEALGPVGETVLGSVAQSIFVRARS